ncbi:NAD(P)-binding domain-containing protein [Thalassoroseus pseudoceratinae]|uniref:NAD(P)-binding domain-containing protein n=1 Tax=Thalassoroseus pseudoceratinae TaxID=2713176 RepID=UPI001421CB63|nr:SidA/IucD/PvdA family monooxygenase [Thalassoroseus pseudoceratinae]
MTAPILPHEIVPVAVLGAGPYGLAIANELQRRGIPFRVFGQPFHLWQERTLSDVFLRSDLQASEIYTHDGRFSLQGFLADRPSDLATIASHQGRIPVSAFRDYLTWVQSQLTFNIERTQVVNVVADGHYFRIKTNLDEEFAARNIVIATGIGAFATLPTALGRLNSPRVIHAWSVEKYADLNSSRVCVVGSGQSAGEAVEQLRKHNETTWIYRSEPIFHLDPLNLPRPIFQFVLRASNKACYFPRILRRAAKKVFVGSTMTPDLKPSVYADDVDRFKADVNSLDWIDRQSDIYSAKLDRCFDAVVCCTGYRLDAKRLPFLEQKLRDRLICENGMPRLSKDFESSAPGIYIAGALAEGSHGPAQRFLIGNRHAAIAISQGIAQKLDSNGPGNIVKPTTSVS